MLNIKGKITAMVQGDGATLNINVSSKGTTINGRTEAEIDRRYAWAIAQGASERIGAVPPTYLRTWYWVEISKEELPAAFQLRELENV